MLSRDRLTLSHTSGILTLKSLAERRRRARPPRRGGSRPEPRRARSPGARVQRDLDAAFADKELSTETVGFAARGLTAAIKGFSSPHWEVRISLNVFPCHSVRTLKSSLPTPANDSRVRFVLQPQNARVAARDVFRNVPAGGARWAVSARAKIFARGAAARFEQRSNTFFSFSVHVQYVPGSLPVRTGEPSTDRARVSRRTTVERKNPK